MNKDPVTQKLTKQLETLGCYSLLVDRNSSVIFQYGDVSDTFNIASIRKSLISLLYGIYVKRGLIDINSTLGELNIDDSPPSLTPLEKSATVKDLLRMRSGIYHEANFETKSARDQKPLRWSRKPGEHYYYNNWDSNTLGTIFTQQTKIDIFEAFKKDIADKIGMPDFKVANCEYIDPDTNSIHRAYKFRLTVRDLSLLGRLLLKKGYWNGEQIIQEDWLNASVQKYSIDDEGKGVGYLWDIENNGILWGRYKYPNGTFGFSGYPGHYLLIEPVPNIVIVYEHDMENGLKPTLHPNDFGDIVKSCNDLVESMPLCT